MKKRSYFLKSLSIALLLLTLASCKNDSTTVTVPDSTTTTTTPTTPIAVPPPALRCPWRKKVEKTCSTGVKYIYGLSSCATDGRSIFCNQALENNYLACAGDFSPETERCKCELLGQLNVGCF